MQYYGERMAISITDYRILRRELRKIEPGLLSDMRKEYRAIAKPVGLEVQKTINTAYVPHGMHSRIGRLSWNLTLNQPLKPSKMNLKTVPKRSSKSMFSSIVSLRFPSAPLVMADMAGRRGKYNDGKMTRLYDYTYTRRDGSKFVGKRQHRINGQGRALVSDLNARSGGKASHYVWRAAMRSLPGAQMAAREVVKTYASRVIWNFK
jgi:hypothetical protein